MEVAQFAKITEAIYSTALDDSRWPDVFETLQQATGLEHLALHGYDNKLQNHTIAKRRRCVYEAFINSFEDYYWKLNPWLPGISKAPMGRAIYAEELCPEEDVRRSEFYNDWARHLDDIGTGGSIVLFRDETRLLTFGGNIPFSQRDALQSNWIALLDQLAPHLKNAFELRRQLAGKQLVDASYLAALDTIPNAVFLLDGTGSVSYSNLAAHRLLKDGSFVVQDAGGRIRVREAKAALILGKALYEIRLKQTPSETRQIVLHDGDGGCKSIATVAPFTPDPAKVDKFAVFAADDIPVAILTIQTQQTEKRPAREVLSALYRLTPAETDLVLALFGGCSLYEYADRRELSRHTVRNQLRKVFEKTGTNSQGRLISELNHLM